MPRLSTPRTPLLKIVFCVLALLALAGCDAPITASRQAAATPTLIPVPPTPTPLVVPVRALDVGGMKVADVTPGPHGLLLTPTASYPLSTQPGSGRSYPTSLSFYNLATRQVTKIVTPALGPDGSQLVVGYATYAGDWVSYETESLTQADTTAWVYNIVSGQRLAIAGNGGPRGAPGAPYEFWVASATDLVWTTTGATQAASVMYDYTFATGQTRILDSSTTEVLKPEAINATSVLFFQDDQNGPNGTTWLQRLDQSAPLKISDEDGVGGSMNASYAVWGDPHTGATFLYDLSAGKLSPSFANCLRPSLDDIGPYMVCLNFSGYTITLIQLPDGAQVIYNTTGKSLGDGATFYDGHGYFAGDDGSVFSFDLPTR